MVPGWYGMQNVKWLTRITVLEEPFTGFQNAVAYRMYGADGEPGEPVTRMLPRSLMVPPGRAGLHDPRRATSNPAPSTLTGRAWSGYGGIERVEVSTDGGATFNAAVLDPPLGPHAWRGWRFDWDARPGEHVLCSRATDAAGNTQPLEPPWNLKGYANNAVERIHVVARLRRLAAPCASSAASSPPGASTSATTSGRSGAISTARSAAIRRSTASSTCTRRASRTTPARSPATCSTRRRC